MSRPQLSRRTRIAIAALLLLFPALVLSAKTTKSLRALKVCQQKQVGALKHYFKFVYGAWGKNATRGTSVDDARAAAYTKDKKKWDKAVVAAEKKGVDRSAPTLDEALNHLSVAESAVGAGIQCGVDTEDRYGANVASRLTRAVSGAFSNLVRDYFKDVKKPDEAKLDARLAKNQAKFIKKWNAAQAYAEGKGIAYDGMNEVDIYNLIDQQAHDLVNLVANGVIDFQIAGGVINGGTVAERTLTISGTLPNPTGDDSEFGGRLMATVNGIEIPVGVTPGGWQFAATGDTGIRDLRAALKIAGEDPGPVALSPTAPQSSDQPRATRWGFTFTFPVDFGNNTVQLKLYDLDGVLLAASSQVSFFSTTTPAAFLATLSWDTADTDVDFHSSTAALDASYGYGTHHTYYSNKTSGWNSNMVLDIDNTWGYGPEHITIDRANPVGEDVFLKVYYYSDHSSDELIPTTAYVSVKVHGQEVYSGSMGLSAESTDSSWGSGAHIWDVGEYTLDPSDQYIVTVANVDTSAFPTVVLDVTVQGRDSQGAISGVDGLTADNFFAINNRSSMTLSSVTGGNGAYKLTYTDKIAGKRPVFVAVLTDDGAVARSGVSDTVTYGKSYALLVGINDYQTINDLSYCVADVDSVEAALQATKMFSGADTQITKMTDSAASKSAVIAALNTVAGVLRPEDLFVFHFSGHGGGMPADPESQQTLCMWDANLTNYDGDISVTELETALGAMDYNDVTNVYVFLDCCHSGNFIDRETDGNKARCFTRPNQPAPPVKTKAFARDLSDNMSYYVMTAATGAQSSWDVGALGHGLFTYYFLEAIGGSSSTSLGPGNANGDIMTTCEEAFAYIQPKVVSYSAANLPNAQTPCSYDDDTNNPTRLKTIW